MSDNNHYKKISSIYDSFAESEEARWKYGVSKYELEVLQEKISKYLNGIERVIDIGSGPGILGIWLGKRHLETTFVDISERSLALAKTRAIFENINNNCFFKLSDARNITIAKDEVYDLALEFGPIYHAKKIEDVNSMLTESYRVLKKGGVYIVNIANPQKVILEAIEKGQIQPANQAFNSIQKEGTHYFNDETEDLGTFLVSLNKFQDMLRLTGYKIIEIFGIEHIFGKQHERHRMVGKKNDSDILRNLVKSFSLSSDYLYYAKIFYIVAIKE